MSSSAPSVSVWSSLGLTWTLTSNGVIKCLLGEVARLIRGVEDLVVEHGEVQCKTKTNRVRRSKVGLGDLSSSLVSIEGLVGGCLALIAGSELGKVTVVIALPVDILRQRQQRVKA